MALKGAAQSIKYAKAIYLEVNEKERRNYFAEFERTIGLFRKKIEADLEFHS